MKDPIKHDIQHDFENCLVGSRRQSEAAGRVVVLRIRNAFVQACNNLERLGKPLHAIMLECLEEQPLATLNAISKFLPADIFVEQNHTLGIVCQDLA